MSSHHHHHHHHHPVSTGDGNGRLTKIFLWGILLNCVYVAFEAVFGLYFDSMGLLSDAGHNLSDVAALLLSLFAVTLLKKKSTSRFTYGYSKATILISLLNAVILLVAVVFIIKESVEKIIHQESVNGMGVAVIAAVGVVINGLTMMFFRHDHKHDLNVKGAYLHMMADALVSVGVVVSGIIIYFTGWNIVDPIIGIVVAVVIVISSWNLLLESVRLALDAVPENISVSHVKEAVSSIKGVKDIHHVHIWALSTTENALTAHVKIDEGSEASIIKHQIKELLSNENITHSTVELEMATESCCDSEHNKCNM